MSDPRPTERMQQLCGSVQEALRELAEGRLDLQGVDRATEDARALYERLVVLRHKAREDHLAPAKAEVKDLPPVIAPPEIPNLRLDTRPTDTPVRQTSLIDAIAETETPPEKKKATPPKEAPAAPKPSVTDGTAPPKVKAVKPAEKPPSLADKLEHAPVADLHKAIALSQKFWFVAELFGGQRERYESAIDRINGMTSLDDARNFITTEILAKAGRPPAEDALRTFSELVERRFK